MPGPNSDGLAAYPNPRARRQIHGFPYDDVGAYSSYVSHSGLQYMLVATGWEGARGLHVASSCDDEAANFTSF